MTAVTRFIVRIETASKGVSKGTSGMMRPGAGGTWGVVQSPCSPTPPPMSGIVSG